MEMVKEQIKKEVVLRKFKREFVETLNCPQTREKLDALFSRDLRLEETSSPVKQALFNHLQSCRDCCRSFDIRVQFCPTGRSRIY